MCAPSVGEEQTVQTKENTSACSCDASRCDELFRLANQAQRAEIVKHREVMMRRLGRIVSLDEAARDWIYTHAASWRAEFEKKIAHR